jgi:succinate dehydrogenase (ubiquinone) membrane anchor subunit
MLRCALRVPRIAAPFAARAFRARMLKAWEKTDPVNTETIHNYVFKSDHTVGGMHLYHKLNLALIGLGPVALVLSPSTLNFPVDVALGVLIPLHAHMGGNDVISDYAHKVTKAAWFDKSLRCFVVFMTTTMLVGLQVLNFQGPGVTESFKSLWRPKLHPPIDKSKTNKKD